MNEEYSKKIYDYLLGEFRSRFNWLKLSDSDIDPRIDGLPTILMDSCINDQFVEEFNKDPLDSKKWSDFFDFIEELLRSGDQVVIDTIETTILEIIASEAYVDVEAVLPYCGKMSRECIYQSIRVFYGKPDRADHLERIFA